MSNTDKLWGNMPTSTVHQRRQQYSNARKIEQDIGRRNLWILHSIQTPTVEPGACNLQILIFINYYFEKWEYKIFFALANERNTESLLIILPAAEVLFKILTEFISTTTTLHKICAPNRAPFFSDSVMPPQSNTALEPILEYKLAACRPALRVCLPPLKINPD